MLVKLLIQTASGVKPLLVRASDDPFQLSRDFVRSNPTALLIPSPCLSERAAPCDHPTLSQPGLAEGEHASIGVSYPRVDVLTGEVGLEGADLGKKISPRGAAECLRVDAKIRALELQIYGACASLITPDSSSLMSSFSSIADSSLNFSLRSLHDETMRV